MVGLSDGESVTSAVGILDGTLERLGNAEGEGESGGRVVLGVGAGVIGAGTTGAGVCPSTVTTPHRSSRKRGGARGAAHELLRDSDMCD